MNIHRSQGACTCVGGTIPALLLAAASRDREVFASPAELQLGAVSNRLHLAFSPQSAHESVGEPLAKLEVQAGFATVLERTQGAFELCLNVTMKPTTLFRGVKSILVRFTPVEEEA